MNKLIITVLLIAFTASCNSQEINNETEFILDNKFDTLLDYFKSQLLIDTFDLPIIIDNVNGPKDRWFLGNLIVKFSDTIIDFEKKELTFSNPFSKKKIPLSYSIYL